ncbi:MAG: methionyl-tRNA formyltransferase, partial [candidate division Zixibacteria bacterium]|nr:methionyl-tRNA formyltransferase [candidate division Zixibacteria bacterium]
LHGSLLPKYRGAAPINWALINGETETGLTIFFLDKKVDTGKIIFRQKISIPPEETFDELHRRMSELAGPVIEKSLDLIESGKAVAEIQDNALATPAPKFSPGACQIDWGFPADNVVNFIRGLSSTPGAFSGFHGKKIKLLRATQCNISILETYEPGQIIMEKNRLIVAVAGGFVEILEILPEGKSKMTGSEFVRGYRPDNREMMSTREREK